MKRKRSARKRQFVVCIRNDGFPASLKLREIYHAIPDVEAARLKHIRVIDESGADYLFPARFFAVIALSLPLERVLATMIEM